MKLGVLFSGGKDSVYAAYVAKKFGHDVVCLLSVFSSNKDSFMFHTPAIENTKVQADAMRIPILIRKTKGEKENELKDLKKLISDAKKKYGIDGVVTGAIKSVYQASRIQKICDELNMECFNPLWQIEEEKYVEELISKKFEIVVVGVFAFPFDESWLFRKIDATFLKELKMLNAKYGINVAGEGGEFETFVLNCPLYKKKLQIKNKKVLKEGGNSFRGILEL